MPVIDATPGGASANSYCTHAEANTYFDARLPLDPPWQTMGEEAALIMAARVLDSLSVARKRLMLDQRGGKEGRPYYVTSRCWTGTPSTSTQSMAWPRTGMYDRLGRTLDPTIVPIELKEAQAEFAGQLLAGDRTLDNDIVLQGISSVKAGSVALAFNKIIDRHVLPNAVVELLVASWLTDEIVTPAVRARFSAL